MGSPLELALRALVGSRCAGVIAGIGTGTVLLLDFGASRRRDIEVPNDRLTYEQRTLEYEMALRINCAWRLDGIDRVLCAWTEFNPTTGFPPDCFESVTGVRVNEVRLTEPALDLELAFESDVSLRVFCDVESEDDGLNYAFRTPGGTHLVQARSRLSFETAKP